MASDRDGEDVRQTRENNHIMSSPLFHSLLPSWNCLCVLLCVTGVFVIHCSSGDAVLQAPTASAFRLPTVGEE